MDKKKQVKENVGNESDILKTKLEEAKKEIEEFRNKYLRALADYQNFEKRIDQQKEEIRKSGEKQLVLKLLPFLDNLEKAEIFIKDKGLSQIKDNLNQILKTEELEEIGVLNTEFDPMTAEAVDIIPGEKDNWVVEVLRKGYKFHGKILRVAQVRVSRKS